MGERDERYLAELWMAESAEVRSRIGRVELRVFRVQDDVDRWHLRGPLGVSEWAGRG